MEIKVKNSKTIENTKKNTIFRIKDKYYYRKYSLPIGELDFSIEIFIFIRKIVFFFGFSMVLKLFTLTSIYGFKQAESTGPRAEGESRSTVPAGLTGGPAPDSPGRTIRQQNTQEGAQQPGEGDQATTQGVNRTNRGPRKCNWVIMGRQ